MSEARNQRKKYRSEEHNPINVTVIVDGIRKVIPWSEYEEKYLNIEKIPEAEVPEVEA